MITTNSLEEKTLDVLDENGNHSLITYREIALHKAGHEAQKRKEFLENLSPDNLQKFLQENGISSIDEDYEACKNLTYNLFFEYEGLCEWEIIEWLPTMELHLTPELQSDYDMWLADVYPPNVGSGSARVSSEWRNYRTTRLEYDKACGYGWWNIKPVWLIKHGYKPLSPVKTRKKK